MDIPTLVADARKDLKALWSHVDKLLPMVGQAARQDPSSTGPLLFPWRSPRNNTWLLRFDFLRNAPNLSAMVWADDGVGGPFALVPASKGISYFLDRDVIARFAERYDPNADAEERVQSFHYENRTYRFEARNEVERGVHDVHVTMDLGMGLGTWDTHKEMVHVRMFLGYAELMPDLLVGPPHADVRGTWDALPVAQQDERIAQAARKAMKVRAA